MFDNYYLEVIVMSSLASLFVVSVSLAIELMLIKLKFFNLEEAKKLKKEMKKIQENIKELMRKFREAAKKQDHKEMSKIQEKIQKKQKKIFELNFRLMKEKLKISLLMFLPAIYIFTKLNDYFGGFKWSWFLAYLISFIIIDKLFRKFTKLDY